MAVMRLARGRRKNPGYRAQVSVATRSDEPKVWRTNLSEASGASVRTPSCCEERTELWSFAD